MLASALHQVCTTIGQFMQWACGFHASSTCGIRSCSSCLEANKERTRSEQGAKECLRNLQKSTLPILSPTSFLSWSLKTPFLNKQVMKNFGEKVIKNKSSWLKEKIIQVVDKLYGCHSRYFCLYSRFKTVKSFCVISSNHKLVAQLWKNGFDPFTETPEQDPPTIYAVSPYGKTTFCNDGCKRFFQSWISNKRA